MYNNQLSSHLYLDTEMQTKEHNMNISVVLSNCQTRCGLCSWGLFFVMPRNNKYKPNYTLI